MGPWRLKFGDEALAGGAVDVVDEKALRGR